MICLYLSTQVLPHFKHTIHASKLPLKRFKEAEITRHEMESVRIRRSIISQP